MSRSKPQKPMTPAWLASIVSAASGEHVLFALGILDLRRDAKGRLYSARLPDYEIVHPNICAGRGRRRRGDCKARPPITPVKYLEFDSPYGGFAARIRDGKLYQGDKHPDAATCAAIVRQGEAMVADKEKRSEELRLFIRLAGGKA